MTNTQHSGYSISGFNEEPKELRPDTEYLIDSKRVLICRHSNGYTVAYISYYGAIDIVEYNELPPHNPADYLGNLYATY